MKRLKPGLTLSAYYDTTESQSLRCGTGIKGVRDGSDFEKYYELGRSIGRGAFSTVQVARCRRTDKVYACKIIDKRHSAVQRVRDEIEILMSVEHRNIVNLHEAFESDEYVFLILDHAQGGELYDQLVKKKKYREKDAKRVVYYLLKACTYLHSKNVVHRDIKLENILLDTNASNSNIVVCDFGLAKVISQREDATSSQSKCVSESDRFSMHKKRALSTCGSDIYISPEIIKGEGYSETVDMWSIGVCMYILLSGRVPFSNDQGDLYKRIERGEYNLRGKEWESISSSAKDLLSRLLQVDPDSRILGEEALGHEWFASLE